VRRFEHKESSMSPTTTSYTVSGMTCDHCTRSVHEEVSEVPGVESAEVDLVSGRLVVVGDVLPADVAAAVREAGYEVAA
jgi:copper chaperone